MSELQAGGPGVKLLLHHFKGRIRFVYRYFPPEEVHPHAVHAAEVAECAGGQGKFWPMHDLLFENQPHLKLPQLHSYAERLDLDLQRYAGEMKIRSTYKGFENTYTAGARPERAPRRPFSSIAASRMSHSV